MNLYVCTFAVGITLGFGGWLVGLLVPGPEANAAVIAGVLYVLVGLWGIVSKMISDSLADPLTEKVETRVYGGVEISKSSWHYRLNKRVSGSEWSPPESLCEYWARTFNNLLTEYPMFGLIYFFIGCVSVLVLLTGWFLSRKPNAGFMLRNECDWFVDGERQWFGPIILAGFVVAVVIGIVNRFSLENTLIALLIAIAGAITIWFLKKIWEGLKFVSQFIVDRNICHKVTYID